MLSRHPVLNVVVFIPSALLVWRVVSLGMHRQATWAWAFYCNSNLDIIFQLTPQLFLYLASAFLLAMAGGLE